jgi:hypothetical protein
VDQAIFFWNETFSVSGQLAPTRGMDETSNFGRYLIELFEAAELEGNPRSAFDALVRETQRSRLIGLHPQQKGATQCPTKFSYPTLSLPSGTPSRAHRFGAGIATSLTSLALFL